MRVNIRKPNYFRDNYDCAEPDICYDCVWYDGKQCIRESLTEDNIEEIEKSKADYENREW